MPGNDKLQDADYENIWLRIKEKVWKWFIGIIVLWTAIIGGIFGVSIYQFINDIAKEKASAYVESPEFKRTLDISIAEATKKSFVKLDNLDQKISILQKTALGMQTSIGQNFVVLTDQKGHTCQIEAGESGDGQVKFKSSFKHNPIVIATPKNCDPLMSKHQECKVIINKISTDGFTVNIKNTMWPIQYNWIAMECGLE